MPDPRPSKSPRGRTLAAACLLATCFARPANATSAADKATAREVATEGIQLFRAGKYADALDRLKRAEALYDVPVHLLYIARCQTKLGQLVEASENYRLLDNYTLPDNAPAPWVSAVDDGRKELAALEPRLPKLRVVTKPADLAEAALTIDGAAVSSAVIGIARPINPGAHHVEVTARGYETAKADVTLAEGQSQDVNVEMHALPEGATPPTSANATNGSSAATATPSAGPAASTPEEGHIGFMVGLRLGAAIPTGTLLHVPAGLGGQDLDTSKAFQPGGALELHGGIRFAKYFTPVFYVGGATLGSGDGFSGISTSISQISNTSEGELGLGIMVGTRPGKFGGFGEFDLGFNAFKLTFDKTCDVTASGGELRFGGGAILPAFDFLNITPLLMISLGRFGTLSRSSSCPSTVPSSISSSDERTHGLILLGVGGDFVFGKDKPSR